MVNLFGKLRKNKVAAKSRSAMRSGLAVWLPFFDMVKKGDLEGLVVKRKDGKYTPADALVQNLKSLLRTETDRQEFFQGQ